MINDVLVIGGGPAGAACALWSHQLGLRVLLVEAGPALGGLQRQSPYTNRWLPGLQDRTGQEVAASLQNHLAVAGVPLQLGFTVAQVRRDPERDAWDVSDGRITHTSRCVVIATGALPRRGGFTATDRIGIGPGLPMERLDVRHRSVAILGGGDNAFDQALFALRRGARRVDVFSRSAPRAQPILQREIATRCVHVGPFHADSTSMTVNGTPYDFFGVQFGFEAHLPPGLRLPCRNGHVDVDRRGAVPGFPGLFAAGEVTQYWHPCVATSYAHGVQVAKSIQAELSAREEVATDPLWATAA